MGNGFSDGKSFFFAEYSIKDTQVLFLTAAANYTSELNADA